MTEKSILLIRRMFANDIKAIEAFTRHLETQDAQVYKELIREALEALQEFNELVK